MKKLIVDLARCNGCRACQIACKDEHCEQAWPPFTAAQPLTGQFWCGVDEEERGKVPVVRVQYTPRFCGHCADAPCLKAARDGAVYRREDGIVVIDPEKARGQKQLVDACPQGMISWNPSLDLPQKCAGCAHLLDAGVKEPRCVEICATGALTWADEEGLTDLLCDAAEPESLSGLGSSVLYRNVPKRWIAGIVADRLRNEVVIGAKVCVVAKSGETVFEGETDEFGDFRFNDCERASYRVVIAVDGYEPYWLEADCTRRDVVFDDVLIDRVGKKSQSA